MRNLVLFFVLSAAQVFGVEYHWVTAPNGIVWQRGERVCTLQGTGTLYRITDDTRTNYFARDKKYIFSVRLDSGLDVHEAAIPNLAKLVQEYGSYRPGQAILNTDLDRGYARGTLVEVYANGYGLLQREGGYRPVMLHPSQTQIEPKQDCSAITRDW